MLFIHLGAHRLRWPSTHFSKPHRFPNCQFCLATHIGMELCEVTQVMRSWPFHRISARFLFPFRLRQMELAATRSPRSGARARPPVRGDCLDMGEVHALRYAKPARRGELNQNQDDSKTPSTANSHHWRFPLLALRAGTMSQLRTLRAGTISQLRKAGAAKRRSPRSCPRSRRSYHDLSNLVGRHS